MLWMGTQSIQLVMAKAHTEHLSFHLFNSPQHPLILGLPWLNPHMNWSTGEILGWGEGCLLTCFPSVSALKPSPQPGPPTLWFPLGLRHPLHLSLGSDFPDVSGVLSCYADLKEVFNKAQAISLPPH